MFTDWLRRLRQEGSVSRIRKPRRLRSRVQSLESRVLLANPVGAEFQVNTFTPSQQRTGGPSSTVAIDADGDFVVAWSSYGQDGSGYGIFAQRYNSAGVAQGGEFQVNTFTTNQQFLSSIAMDADGDFVVAWISTGQDGSGNGIYAQRYNAAGVAQGGEFRVNSFTTNNQRNVRLAMDADGDFTAVWSSSGQDGSSYGIYGQRFNAAGVAQGTEFRVNNVTANVQDDATIATDANGNFVVTWSSINQDGSSSGIYSKRYNAAGVALTGDVRVNTYTTNSQRYSTVAMDTDGDYVVTWSSYTQDGDTYGIFAQRFNSAGVAQGTEFRVNNYTTNYQRLSSVAMDADGDFVVAWGSYTQDGDEYGVYAQQYSSTGVRQGGEFRVNTFTNSTQRLPTVAMDAAGEWVATWSSYGQDGSGYGVFAQRYAVNSGFNQPPVVNNQAFNVAENRPIGFQVGTVAASDPDAGQSLTYALVGGNTNNTFAINATTGALTVNNTTLNFETQPQYQLLVEVTDNGNPALATQAVVTVNVVNLNEAPTITFANTVPKLSEATSTAVPIRVADIVISDDGLGTNVLSLAGNDATLFEISGNQLRLKAGVKLDFETKPALNVFVLLNDDQLPGSPDAQASFTLGILNANEPPLVDIVNPLQQIQENVNTTSPIAVATIQVTDDSLGIETLSLSGDDADLFEIIGNQIRIKAGSVINYESTDTVLRVTVNVDDAAIGTSPDDSADLEIQVIDVNEAPTLVVQPLTTSLPETASTSTDRLVANITVNDDALGTNTLSLSGFGGSVFKIFNNQLFLKAGTKLDFETTASYSTTILLNDPAVGGSPDGSFNFRLSILDVNEPPVVPSRSFSIPTRPPRGTLVGTVTATDQDAGQTLTYAIVGGNSDGAFAINSFSGQITVVKPLALRQPRVVALTVRATDDGSPTTFGQGVMTINVGTALTAPPATKAATTAAKPAAAVTQVATTTATAATPASKKKDAVATSAAAPATSLLSRVLTAIKPKSK